MPASFIGAGGPYGPLSFNNGSSNDDQFARPYTISGITKDSFGNPLGSCAVQLFRTEDSILVNSTISDLTTGGYVMAANPNIQHFAVAYIAGPNDQFGTTENTLLGT